MAIHVIQSRLKGILRSAEQITMHVHLTHLVFSITHQQFTTIHPHTTFIVGAFHRMCILYLYQLCVATRGIFNCDLLLELHCTFCDEN